MTSKVIKLTTSSKGNKIAYAILIPSLTASVETGAKTRLVRCMATKDMVVGSVVPELDKYTLGQTSALPPRTDGKPSQFSEISWIDRPKA